MNRTMSIALMIYAVVLVPASAIPLWVEPEVATQTIMLGGGVSVLCMIWGLLGLNGSRSRIGPGLTLGAIGFVLLAESITRWMPSSGNRPMNLLFTIVVTLMLFVTLGLLGWMLPREEFHPHDDAETQKRKRGSNR